MQQKYNAYKDKALAERRTCRQMVADLRANAHKIGLPQHLGYDMIDYHPLHSWLTRKNHSISDDRYQELRLIFSKEKPTGHSKVAQDRDQRLRDEGVKTLREGHDFIREYGIKKHFNEDGTWKESDNGMSSLPAPLRLESTFGVAFLSTYSRAKTLIAIQSQRRRTTKAVKNIGRM